MSRGNVKDLAGQRFGRLVVLDQAGRTKDRCVLWKCKCDCGNECTVSSRSLLAGATKSCGCLADESKKTARSTHHKSTERIYFLWQGMRKRCFSPTHKNYESYGGRGITVCEEWDKDFQAFYDYVSRLEHFGKKGYTLDRINNNGNYEPGNVRWATAEEQGANRRDNVFIEAFGKTLTVAEWAKELNIPVHTIYSRISLGFAPEDCLSLVKVQRRDKGKHHNYPKKEVRK